AVAIEAEAKRRLGLHTHRRGTPTTATKGGPPALVSGTLRRAITHSRPELSALGWEVRVGVASGFYPPYPMHGTRTPASKYGSILELELDYPFLEPSFRKVVEGEGAALIGRLIHAEWHKP